MNVSITEAKRQLSKLLRAVESGEQVIITRRGKPVAQLLPAPSVRREIQLGGMKDRIRLLPGWDDPISEEDLVGVRIH